MQKIIFILSLCFLLQTKLTAQTIHVEAENWYAMSGVVTGTTTDAGGGLDVGNINIGDWMDYNINPSVSGTYTVNIRISTPYGSQLKIKKSDGTLLATVAVPVTGGFQSYQTITSTISLTAGTQHILIESLATGTWNFNWFELVAPGGGGGTNQPPTLNAGTDQSITLPVSSVTLTGTASDADGTIVSYNWSKVSGPAGSTVTSPNSITTTVTGLAQGIYVFRFTVTDNGGATPSDDITITVNAAASAWSTSGNAALSSEFIGTTNASDLIFKTNNTTQAKITSGGELWAKKIKVTQTGWADFVFDPVYKLRPLSEVQAFIQKHKHLPDVPSEKQVIEQGLNVGDNQAVLLRKIEELTLYLLEQNEQLKKQNQKLEQQSKEIKELKKQIKAKR